MFANWLWMAIISLLHCVLLLELFGIDCLLGKLGIFKKYHAKIGES
ncbi:unnamed protein product [Brugia timori]|uniref:DUF1304 domain-containing protein n=1 Tax=Brugia timori TaxID=42155 RepID=A0A0R3QGQ9_9BILA|nr:unnamed protein product [Brugia timori]